MRTPNPTGFPKASFPDAPQLREREIHWSWDARGARRLRSVEKSITTAKQRLLRRMILQDL